MNNDISKLNKRNYANKLKAIEALSSLVAENSIPEPARRHGISVGRALEDKLKTLKNGQSLKFDMELFSYANINKVVAELNRTKEYVRSKFHTTTMKDKGVIYVWLNPIS